MKRFPRSTALALWFAAAGLPVAGGCAAQVSVWGNSDSLNPKDYTQTSPHYVHVGETAQFRVTVEPDIADYVVLEINGEAHLLNRVATGQYAFSKHFDQALLNKTLRAQAKAYRQQGRRDYVETRGRIVKRSTASDPSDELLGAGSMMIKCYQSKVVIKFTPDGRSAPDWRQGTLELFDETGKAVRVAYGQPGRHGFVVLGPEAFGGEYVVYYEPEFDEVRRSGKTRAVFTVPGAPGQTIQVETEVETR